MVIYLPRRKLLWGKSDSMSDTYLCNPQLLAATKPFHLCPYPKYIERIALLELSIVIECKVENSLIAHLSIVL